MKIKNDKGLPIRKAIYSIVKILLDCIPEKINVTETLQMCLYGLGKFIFNFFIYFLFFSNFLIYFI